MPTGEKLPPAQATKVLSVGADEIRIIIDMSMFYTRAHGYECFTLKKENGSWKIDSIESVAQAVWDGR